MNIFDFAIGMEKEGEEYYRQAAERISLPGIKNIFTFLADEEVWHANILQDMKKGIIGATRDSTLFSDSKSVFHSIARDLPEFNTNMADLEAYEHALDLEKQSESFYRKEAEKSDDEKIQKILIRIADEEHRHVLLLEHLKEYASHPYQWIENHEFNHLDNY